MGMQREVAPGFGQQRRLAAGQLVGCQRLDDGRLVVAVLHDADAAQHRHLGADDGRGRGKGIGNAPGVVGGRALALAQPHGQHLEQPALPLGAKRGVGLDAVDDQNAVGLRGEAVEEDRHAVGRFADLHGLHVALDGQAQRRRPQPVALQHLALAFGRAAAVAAHGRHQERLGATRSDGVDQRGDDRLDAADAAAAHADGNALSRLDRSRAWGFVVVGRRRGRGCQRWRRW